MSAMSNLKKVLNFHEEATHLRLREVCERQGAAVFSKVRLADILPIENSGISDAQYRFALQAHFDFVVADASHNPLFAVEFDGPLHASDAQKGRDDTKSGLCEKFELPLLRVNSNYLRKSYRGMDLLSWFVEVWFAWGWFQEAQRKGELPMDEIFMPQMMVTVQGHKNQFPLWLSAPIRNKIQKLCFSGKVVDMVPSHIVGKDGWGNFRALAYIRITTEQGIIVDTAMRAQSFPVSETDALEEIVTFQLYEKLCDTLKFSNDILSLTEIANRLEAFKSSHELRRAMSHSSSVTTGDPLSK